ncbi:hypothetical protein VKT23_012738 [Stygiomarasmius scandens]|uniref:Uncharacterized protein n=1 Tax=Marasmiellus scandens TaxID=2682957 RepID=A0ABR1J5K2_9AGAR
MLEKYRIPFLLLRVADMRYVTRGPGSQATALSLYAELGKMISDSNYTKWLSQLAHTVKEQTEDMLVKYKSAQHFTPAQLWIPGTSHDSLPQCCIQELIDDLKTRWKAIERGDSAAMSKVFDFDFSVTTVPIQKGPFDEVVLREICDSDVQPGGTVVDVWDALLVLQCTVKVSLAEKRCPSPKLTASLTGIRLSP